MSSKTEEYLRQQEEDQRIFLKRVAKIGDEAQFLLSKEDGENGVMWTVEEWTDVRLEIAEAVAALPLDI